MSTRIARRNARNATIAARRAHRRAIARCTRTMTSNELRQLAEAGAAWAARELATRRA